MTSQGDHMNGEDSTATSSSSSSPSGQSQVARRRSGGGGASRLSPTPRLTQRFDIEGLLSSFLDASAKETLDGGGPLNTNAASMNAARALKALKQAVLLQGLPDPIRTEDPDPAEPRSFMSLRGRVWKAFLGIREVDSDNYMELVERKRSSKFKKIRGDTFRTFPKDRIYTERVPEARLVRVLNSFQHQFGEVEDAPIVYLQGMNAIAAPLLWCMSEVDAYHAFCHMVLRKTPLYWLNDVVGAHTACKLVDRCLQIVDPELAKYLKSHGNLTAYGYAFSIVSSLSASVPPFEELVKLWDFLIAFGPHMSVLCVVAQVIMLRDKLMKTPHPKNLLDYRKWPHLKAKMIIGIAMSIVPKIHRELWEDICNHGVDPEVTHRWSPDRKVVYTPPHYPWSD